jgi:hypothetical protein
MVMYGPPGGPYAVRTINEGLGTGNWMIPNAAGTVVPGNWYRIEWYIKLASSSTANDGISRWWVNGALAGNVTNINTGNNVSMSQFEFAPTWGGTGGGSKTQNDSYRFDHVYMSQP